ncbi:hypothetical protein [Roseomonas sp. CECT 9278]|uniref:hypothetical protein n=1 Tax=Roseomonas sp. CECT 9278 TaxID=2845823 RepID=UPI001E5B0DC3|nr:hypothetical protein [Roseomonas sp. CECT 9278]CAH0210857.1 hypothetical protein ROS9278_02161 [Roseomonas sp. CECT 9278]
MSTASAPGPDQRDPPAAAPRFAGDADVPPPRQRPPALRLLAIGVLSIIVSALLLRAVVEVVRWAAEP